MRPLRRNPEYRPPGVIATLYDDAVFGYRGAFDTLRQNVSTTLTSRQQLRLHQRWFELVAMYTSGHLTQPTDRLIGISGIAKAIQGDKKGMDYVGGLWRHHLLFDLLWCLGESPKPRPKTYRAPSWSWVAVDGSVSQRLLPFTTINEEKVCKVEHIAEVIDVAVTKSGQPATSADGLIDDGHLDLQCHILPVSTVASAADQADPLTLEIAGYDGTFPADFVPDIVLSDPVGELFCAEILRMGFVGRYSPKVLSRSTHGIVLRRMMDATVEDGGHALYERVGRFWVGLEDVVESAPGDGRFGHSPIERVRIV